MISFFWKILSLLVLPVFLPGYALYTWVSGNKSRGFLDHLGLVPRLSPRSGDNSKVIWLFALSVGEVGSAVPVMRKIRQRNPNIRVVVSVTTEAGYEAAQREFDFAEAVFFNPMDLWPFPQLACSRIGPDLFVLTETGFWPGQLSTLTGRQVKVLLFQGRISNRSFEQYRKIKFFFAPILDRFEWLCMQSQDGVEKVRSLGVASEKIILIGNTKFDSLRTLEEIERCSIRKSLSLAEGIPVFIAGSTHEEEEEVLVNAFLRLKVHFPKVVLILAPRRLERLPALELYFKSQGVEYVKRSEIAGGRGRGSSLILLDTMGELSRLYSIADAAFIGKSLFFPGGGHSLLEPAAQGVPVLHGPYIEYQKSLAEPLQKEGVAITVTNAEDIEITLTKLFYEPSRRKKLGQKAKNLIDAGRGAAEKMADIILETMNH